MTIDDEMSSTEALIPPSVSTNNDEEILQNGNDSMIHHDNSVEIAKLSAQVGEEGGGGQKKLILALMCFVNVCNSICFSQLSPFFPKEAASKGVSVTMIGIIFSLFEVTMFIFCPLFGTFVSHFGVKFLFCWGLFISGVCTVLFAFVDDAPDGIVYIVMCILCRGIESIGGAMFVTASFTVVCAKFPGKVSTVFGLLETFSAIGLMIGPAVGGALYQLGGFKLPFLSVGGLILISTVVSVILLPKVQGPARSSSMSVFHLLKFCPVILVCVTIMVDMAVLGFYDPTFALHLEPFHLSPAVVGVIFIIGPGVYAFTAPAWGYIGDKFKTAREPMMIFGQIPIFIALWLGGPAPFLSFLPKESLVLNIMSLVLFGLFVGAPLVPTASTLVTYSKSYAGYPENIESFGLVSGLLNSCFSFGAFIGPFSSGYMVDSLKFPMALTIVGCVVAGWAVSYGVIYYYLKCSGRVVDTNDSVLTDDNSEINENTPLLRNQSAQSPAANV